MELHWAAEGTSARDAIIAITAVMSATIKCSKHLAHLHRRSATSSRARAVVSLLSTYRTLPSDKVTSAPSSSEQTTKPIMSIFDKIVTSNFGLAKNEKVEVKQEAQVAKEDVPLDAENINTIFYSKYKSGVTNMTDALEGTYVSISNDDIKRYVPEGLPKEISDEFRFTSRSEWMIRDASKVLFNFIEAFDKKNIIDDSISAVAVTMATATNNSNKPTKAAGKDAASSSSAVKPEDIVALQPGLTDRNEWPSAYLKTTLYGHEIPFDKTKKSYVAKDIVESIREKYNSDFDFHAKKTQSLPDKIVISGKKGTGKSFALAQAVIHARARGWIVLYIPNGWKMAHDGAYVEPINPSPTPIPQNGILFICIFHNFPSLLTINYLLSNVKNEPLIAVELKKAAPYLEDTETFYSKAIKVKQKAHDAVAATPSFTRDIGKVPSHYYLHICHRPSYNICFHMQTCSQRTRSIRVTRRYSTTAR